MVNHLPDLLPGGCFEPAIETLDGGLVRRFIFHTGAHTGGYQTVSPTTDSMHTPRDIRLGLLRRDRDPALRFAANPFVLPLQPDYMDRRGIAPNLVLERLFEKVIQGGDFSDLDTMVAADIEFRTINFDTAHNGIDAYQDHVKQLHEGVSEIEITYDILVRTPDSLTVEFTVTGRHTGAVMGVEPTSNTITYSGINSTGSMTD